MDEKLTGVAQAASDGELLGLSPLVALSDRGIRARMADEELPPASWLSRLLRRRQTVPSQIDLELPGLAALLRSGDQLRIFRGMDAHNGAIVHRRQKLLLAVGDVAWALGIRPPQDPEDSGYVYLPWSNEKLITGNTTTLGEYQVTLVSCSKQSVPGRLVELAIVAPEIPVAVAIPWAKSSCSWHATLISPNWSQTAT